MENLDDMKRELLAAIGAAGDLDALERARVEALGKKGRITGMMKSLGALDPEARRKAGQALNLLKDEVGGAIEARKAALGAAALDARLAAEAVDVTLPPRRAHQGRLHPITQTIEECIAIFGEMGFKVAEGP